MFTLTISTIAETTGSAVISKDNPTPVPLNGFVLGNVLNTNLFLADGLGDYDDASGTAGYSVLFGLGQPGNAALWTNTTWTPITNGWNGNLHFDSPAIKDLFDSSGVNPLELTLEITVTDSQSRPVTTALIPIKVWNKVVSDEDLADPPTIANADGEYAVPNGVDVGSVTGLNLAAAPRRVMVGGLRKPIGGLNIFASVVSGSITTDGFDFTLSGQTDAATYKLDYLLIF